MDSLHERVLHDWVFGVTILWPLVSYLLEFKCWFTAPGVTPAAVYWRLRVSITTQNIHLKTYEVLLGNIPATPPAVEAGVVGFAFTEKIENPNLVRVHTGIPIEVTEVVRPGPGQTIGSLVKHEVKYDVRDYEPLPEPAVEDTSAAARVECGMPRVGAGDVGSPAVEMAPALMEEIEVVVSQPTSLTPAVRKAIDLVNKKRRERGRPGEYKPVEDLEDLDAVSSEEPER